MLAETYIKPLGTEREQMMKKLLLISLLLLPVSLIGLTRSEDPAANQTPSVQTSQAKILVDGAINPEMISDYRAYSLLFRFI